MAEPPEPPEPPEPERRPAKRVGDRERADVDARLQAAHADGVLTLSEFDERVAQCWAAITRDQLDVLVEDLPDPGEAAPLERPAGPASAQHGSERPWWSRRPVVAAGAAVVVLGVAGSQLVGVFGAEDGTSIFGSRTISVAAGQDRVEVGMIFGSLDVVVPDDTRVRVEGSVVFGSVECEEACGVPGAAEIVVDVSGAFGSVEIVAVGEAGRDDD